MFLISAARYVFTVDLPRYVVVMDVRMSERLALGFLNWTGRDFSPTPAHSALFY